MSTPPLPPERPTEPLRPPRPPVAPLVAEPAVAGAIDPNLILLRLEESLASLRTWLALVAALALVALGLAIYAALADNNSGAQSGSRHGLASDARVSQVNARVDRLSGQVKALRAGSGSSAGASATDTTALNARVDALERSVKTISARPAGVDPTQALSQLSGRVDSLTRDVAQLKQGQTQATP